MLVDIEESGCGVNVKEENVSILVYADDVVMCSDSPDKLDHMIGRLDSWCNKWKLKINVDKSQIVHFRRKRVQQSSHAFHLQGARLKYSNSYKYLGVIFDAHMTFKCAVDTLATASGRALGSVITKYKTLKYMHFNTFSLLYNTCVTPVMDYAAEIWGVNNFDKPLVIQNRAMRYFLGVHRFAPTLAVAGDTGWLSCNDRWTTSTLIFWNHLVNMVDSRLTKRLFMWDRMICSKNWSSFVKDKLDLLDLSNSFYNLQKVNLEHRKHGLVIHASNKWKNEVSLKPKLRTYAKIKHNLETENYLHINLSRSQRSLISQLRCGILPLRLETGRYVGEEIDERVCTMCDERVTEDEIHFVLKCNFYSAERVMLLEGVNHDSYGNDNDILCYLMTHKIHKFGSFLESAFLKRKNKMYTAN